MSLDVEDETCVGGLLVPGIWLKDAVEGEVEERNAANDDAVVDDDDDDGDDEGNVDDGKDNDGC